MDYDDILYVPSEKKSMDNYSSGLSWLKVTGLCLVIREPTFGAIKASLCRISEHHLCLCALLGQRQWQIHNWSMRTNIL